MQGDCATCEMTSDNRVSVTHFGGSEHDTHRCYQANSEPGHVIQWGGTQYGTVPQYAADTESHEVRCCSDEAKPNWVNRGGACSVWGESYLPGCIDSATFAEATDHCAAQGGRLCTAQELADDCTRGSGCGHDAEQIWSSDATSPSCECVCAHSETAAQYMVQMGSSHYNQNGNAPVAKDADSTHEVRCCSDVTLPGFQKINGCSIWGESFIPQCEDASTWAEAVTQCDAIGARLCTAQELSDDCTRGTGCGHDAEQIWSSTAAPTAAVQWILDHRNSGAQSCSTVCADAAKTCDQSSLDNLNNNDAAFEAAFEAWSPGHCTSWNTGCTSGNDCAAWGSPFIHNSHINDNTNYANGNGLCWKGSPVAACGQQPVDGNHRRLCPCM